ncbi:MAG TPA: ferritin-like domain-containing protein [Solirubrobacteraceae bacterium]|nr:ferritin-like domain-containing protein [Solirubrobacteraceae bacterium]
MVTLSRRRFLGAAGALAGALLTGCGRDAARERPPSDADVLAGLLRHELRTWEAVRGVAGAEAIGRQDEEHVVRLSALTGAPVAELEAPPRDDPQAALARKQEGVFAYVEALPRLSDPDLRALVMQLAASDAEHLAALRLAAGEEPVPDAFAGFTEAPER